MRYVRRDEERPLLSPGPVLRFVRAHATRPVRSLDLRGSTLSLQEGDTLRWMVQAFPQLERLSIAHCRNGGSRWIQDASLTQPQPEGWQPHSDEGERCGSWSGGSRLPRHHR